MRKLFIGAGIAAFAVALSAGPAFAHDCVNLSKNTSSVGVIVGTEDSPCPNEVIITSNGLQQRLDKFGFDGVNFTGPMGIDVNCDGIVDVTSYSPGGGTQGVIPAAEKGQGQNRALCKGLTNVETAIADDCVVVSGP